MGPFFDMTDGDICMDLGGNMLMDSDGNLMQNIGGNIAMDMSSGEMHLLGGGGIDPFAGGGGMFGDGNGKFDF